MDRIIEQLSDGNYFPDNNVNNIIAIVKEETRAIHSAAYPYLVNKIVELLAEPDADKSKNARFMLSGMANLPEMHQVIAEKFVQVKCSDIKYGAEIAAVLSTGPSLIKYTNSTTKSRLNSLILNLIENTKITLPATRLNHPLYFIKSMLSVLDEDTLFSTFQRTIDKMIEKYWSNPALIEAFSNSDRAFTQLCDHYVKSAGSNNFNVANEFAMALPDLDQKLSDTVSKQIALKLIGAVYSAAENRSWQAQSLRSGKFASVQALKLQAVSYITEEQEAATETLNELGVSMDACDFQARYLSNANIGNED